MNKASGGDGTPAELLKILKDDAVKVLHSICQHFAENSAKCHKMGKGQLSFQSQRKATPKNARTTLQSCTFHSLARLCSKPFNQGFDNSEPRTSRWASWIQKGQSNRKSNCQSTRSQKRQRNLFKTKKKGKEIYFCLTTLKPLTMWIIINGKILKEMPPENTVRETRSHSQNETQNNRRVQRWERSTSRLYTAILLI